MVVKIDFALDIFAGLFSAAAVPNKKQTAVVYRACLEHNANVGEVSVRPRVPRQPVFVLRSFRTQWCCVPCLPVGPAQDSNVCVAPGPPIRTCCVALLSVMLRLRCVS